MAQPLSWNKSRKKVQRLVKFSGLNRLKEALDVLQETGDDACDYARLLQECVCKKCLAEGKLIHAHMIQRGSLFLLSDTHLGNNLISMYTKCGSLSDARRAFDEMPERNVVSWTAMIAAYSRNALAEEALALFHSMKRSGIQPNEFTFASVLPACANLANLELGRGIHEDIIRNGYDSDVFVGSALIDMYVKCQDIEDAHQVFDKMTQRNVVSWNAMIAGYAQNGYIHEALKLFQKMPERNVVSWTAMIAGYEQNGYFDEVLKLYHRMKIMGLKPDSDTFASVLPACANLAALEHGKDIHQDIIRSGFQSDIFVGSALVDMYAKCGSIEDARDVFDTMPGRNLISWTVMIAGYAMHGCGREALLLFERMQHSGIHPDHVTFVGVLSACCHAGLVEEGLQCFDCMSQVYHLRPALEHYCCVVDLLGRAGRLKEAYDFISKMPIKPGADVWACLLGACRIHTNTDLGERVAEILFELDPDNSANYVLLSNIYAVAGRWDDMQKVRKHMNDRRVKKKPGSSWIEINNKLYAFRVEDRSHHQLEKKSADLE